MSTGGVQALQQLLPGFPANAPGIVIVQHMPPDFTTAFANRLHNDPRIEMEVAEARQHEPIRAGPGPGHPGRHPRPGPPLGHRLSRRAGRGPAGLPPPAQRRGPVSLGRPGGRALSPPA